MYNVSKYNRLLYFYQNKGVGVLNPHTTPLHARTCTSKKGVKMSGNDAQSLTWWNRVQWNKLGFDVACFCI